MTLHMTKAMVAAVWVLAVVLVGIVASVSSTGGLVLLAAFGALPPLAMLVIWQDPPQTLSEAIHDGRR